MSVYKRGKNWYVDFVFKGQRVRESIGPSKKTAEKIISKKKAEIAENKYLDIRKEPDPVKFHDFSKEYLAWAKINKKPTTYVRDLSIIRLLDAEFEGKTIQEITPWQIEKYRGKRKEISAPATVNRELSVLKHLFSRAIEWGRLQENPAKKAKFFKGAAKRVRFLMPDEIQTLILNCEDWLKPIVTVAVHTGMRKGEILSLEWSQVNFEQGIISILDTKNHERRDLPMDETVKATFQAIEKTVDLVFPDNKGKRMCEVRLHRAFHEALDKSGITDFHFHDLRHTFASNLVMQEGVELNDVRELLGHKTMAMTLRYAHLSPKHKTRVVNLLDSVLGKTSNVIGLQEVRGAR
jgi:integrase